MRSVESENRFPNPVKGYEIIHKASDMDLTSYKPLLFYSSMQSEGSSRQIGLLLAGMEQKKIIDPNVIRMATKGVKVRYTGWEPRPGEQIRKPVGGLPSTAESVQLVTTFIPKDESHAKDIAYHLLEYATENTPWRKQYNEEIADIRATIGLEDALDPLGFQRLIANIKDDRVAG